MFGKLLCKIKIHDWELVRVGDWILEGWNCTRCGKRRKRLNRNVGWFRPSWDRTGRTL